MFRKTLIAAVAITLSSTAFAAPPREFLKDAIQGDYSEATLGRLIQQRGASAQVRNFGATLNRDHSNGLAQAQRLASRLGLHIPVKIAPEARAELPRLRHLSGRAFDREVRRYMVQDHVKDIAKFKAQVRSGDRATSGFAAATVPVLEKHLAMARAIRA
jgi:putative membrane protein